MAREEGILINQSSLINQSIPPSAESEFDFVVMNALRRVLSEYFSEKEEEGGGQVKKREKKSDAELLNLVTPCLCYLRKRVS